MKHKEPSECCGKCWHIPTYTDHKNNIYRGYCFNTDCPCHSTEPAEFDVRVKENEILGKVEMKVPDELKPEPAEKVEISDLGRELAEHAKKVGTPENRARLLDSPEPAEKIDTNKRMGGWEIWHFWRECHNCGYAGTGFLHCLHDGTQNNCPRCDEKMPSIPEDCDCEFVSTNEEIKEKIDVAHSEGFKEGVEKAVGCVPKESYGQGLMFKAKYGIRGCAGWNACREKMLEALRSLKDGDKK